MGFLALHSINKFKFLFRVSLNVIVFVFALDQGGISDIGGCLQHIQLIDAFFIHKEHLALIWTNILAQSLLRNILGIACKHRCIVYSVSVETHVGGHFIRENGDRLINFLKFRI